MHGGVLWFNKPDLMEFIIVSLVIGLPTTREDTSIVLIMKDATYKDVYYKYGTRRGDIGFIILEINENIIWFTTQQMA
jgi:hypothetical protein